jgi:hypothetical protein
MRTFRHIWRYFSKFFLQWGISWTRCRDNQNIHFMLKTFFSENCIVYETMLKTMVEIEGPQMASHYGAYAVNTGLARLNARIRTHTPTRPDTHMHACTRTHAYKDQ